jgi:glycosyltransferase involved in cell wall biosynthesis
MADHRPHALHAWGTNAGGVARHVRPAGVPIALTVTDPAEIGDVRRWWPLHADPGSDRHGTVLCASEFVRSRMVGLGVPRDATVLVRPGVDGDGLAEARRRVRRSDLGLPETGPILLTASPPTRAGGQFFAAWAAAILFQVWPDVRLVIPGRSREQDRIRRLIEGIYCPQVFLLVEDRFTPAELLAVSDALLMPAVQDIPTYWSAAAMTAGVPVVPDTACGLAVAGGSTVPSLAEDIADESIGGLCRPGLPRLRPGEPGEPHTLAIRVRQALGAPDRLAQCVAAARRQAQRRFDARTCVEAHLGVYSQLASPLARPADVR